MLTVVDEAVSDDERRVFWDRFALAHNRLADDTDSWNEAREERESEAGALNDESR